MPLGLQLHINKMINLVEERTTSMELPEIDIGAEHMKDSPRKKYGNLIVLFNSGNCLLTIGPHYYFFLPTLMCFIAAGVFLILYVNSTFTSTVFKIINACFSMLQTATYLVVALSNPGIIYANQPQTDNNSERQKIVCDKCGASHRSKRVRHCNHCDICVRGYDHHCPWVSKCIGAGNYSYFNFFVGITPLYLMYYIVVLLVCLNFSLAASLPPPTP